MTTNVSTTVGVSDAELVRAAMAGDTTSLGMALARNRPAMYACAVAILGSGEGAQDAVQDACVVAVRRLGELRDPEAFGGWLWAITRNVCLTELRRGRREVVTAAPPEPDAGDDVAAVVEQELHRHALRAHVWAAIEALPAEQRLVVMLRYFGRERQYEDIAQICGVPVGTVRSRLNAARRALADRLLAAAVADEAHDARAEQWRARLGAALTGLNRGDPAPVRDLFAPDALIRARGRTGHVRHVVPALLEDSEVGVRLRVADVVAGAGALVLDGDIDNPPDDPLHCPPSFTWVASHRDGRVARLQLFHPSPASRPGTRPQADRDARRRQ